MKGSDLLVRCLEHEGVERMFGIPGEENLDLMDSLISSDIDFILTKHESSAAFMAGITGRLKREPGVCLSTLGPGASNMVIGVSEAYLGYEPIDRIERPDKDRKAMLASEAIYRSSIAFQAYNQGQHRPEKHIEHPRAHEKSVQDGEGRKTWASVHGTS